MVYDAARARTVLFGGTIGLGDQVYTDTWEWDGINWTQMSPAHVPPGREGFAMAYDAQRQATVLFGGLAASGGIWADTWVWNGSDWVQQAPINSPSLRSGVSMVYDAAHQQTLLFGGVASGPASANAETWTWDGSNWTQRAAFLSPGARFEYAMAYESVHSQPILFGGANGDGTLGDTWEWVAPTVNLVPAGNSVITTPGSAFFEIGVQLNNMGNVPVTNLSISTSKFAGVAAASFSPSSFPVLAPGASASFTIQFPVSAIPPSRAGVFTAQGTYSAAGVVGASWTENVRSFAIQQ
jgi:hypothetical protein